MADTQEKTVVIVKLGAGFGFVADDPKASRGTFFHRSIVEGAPFYELKVGQQLHLRGTISQTDKGAAVAGRLLTMEALAAEKKGKK